MMQKPWSALCAAILLVGFVSQQGMSAPESLSEGTPPVRLLAVKVLDGPSSTSLQMLASGAFSFTSYQPDGRSLIVDLAGVVADPGVTGGGDEVAWTASYRLLPFRNAAGRHVLRLDLTLARDCTLELTQPQPDVLLLSCPSAAAEPATAGELGDVAPAQEPLQEVAPQEPLSDVPLATETASAIEPAPVAVTRDGPVYVRGIKVHREEGGVTIEVQAATALGYETRTLANPTRLVIDLPESILLTRQRQFMIDQQEIVAVRVAQFKAEPPITRVVVDLLAMVPYEISPTPQGLRLILRSPGARGRVPDPAAGPALPLPGIKAVPKLPEIEAEPPQPSTQTTFLPEAPQSSATPASPVLGTLSLPELPEPPLPAPPAGEGVSPQPAPILLASLAPMVPAAAAEPSVPTAAVEPAEVPSDTEAAPSAVVPRAEVVEPAPQLEEPQAPPSAEMPPPPEAEAPRTFSGEPISVNLKDLDLKDFFRLIHEISGLNIVLDPNVSGSVTMVLIDVPWDQALDIVLKNNGLGSTLEGNVLRIATLGTLKEEQDRKRELARAREEAVDRVTVTRQLSYAKATDLEPTLKRFLSSRGDIIRDDRTNTLIIRDIPQVVPDIDNLIQQLDRKSLQVEIEARVVSASRAFAREIGSQLATSFSTTGGRSVFGGALGPSALNMGAVGTSIPPPPLISTGGDGGTQSLASDLRVVDPTAGFLFGHRSPNFALDVILTAAESRNIAKVLSKPRLVTQNNITAEVKQGTRIPVQTVVNNTISTQFLDVVLRLNVTPQITADGTVFLNIVIENTSVDPGIARINGIPALATQSTTTQVLIPDGGTVVIGGVMVTSNATTVDQVPLLGSVPVIGHLFKRTRVETSTQELLFFITPRILPG